MTDDFHLFADPDDGVDPDVALITAYLARELSPMQVLALEERLATDDEFRSDMQPLIDAWAAPVPSFEGGLARRAEPLSPLERAESWRRFQSEGVPDSASQGVALETDPRTTRRMSMKRIALFAAAVALPMVSFAQVVVYAADHADVPGHSLAQSLVSVFAHSSGTHIDLSASPANHSSSEITDARVERPLSAAKPVAPESLGSAAPIAAPAPAPEPAKARGSIPNRALVAELTRRYHPGVVRGDTSAGYVVMVLDATEDYVWSTIGEGGVSIQVGADPRTPAERAAFTRAYRDEFWDDTVQLARGRGGRGSGAGFGGGVAGRGRAGAGTTQPDSLIGRLSETDDRLANFARRVGRGMQQSRMTVGDTVYTLLYDTLIVRVGGDRGIVSNETVGADSGGRGFGGRAGRIGGRGAGRGRGAFVDATTSSPPGTYRAGWVGPGAGAAANQAAGLEPAGSDRSGIRGLASSFVESADTYFFAPRELAPIRLKVMVVWLSPGASWRGPQ